MASYWILFIFIFAISTIVSMRFKGKFAKYSKIPLHSGMTGQMVAEKMLRDNGILDVQVISNKSFLGDHYNPANKTVNLSEEVYHGTSIISAAVAAHECGHAVQHATAYSWLELRSKLVPVVSGVSNFIPWVLMGGILLINTFPELLLGGIIMFAITTAFSFITLPVEYDASKRALVWLKSSNLAVGEEYEMAKDGLNWAANTYVVAAISSLATLLWYVMIFMRRN